MTCHSAAGPISSSMVRQSGDPAATASHPLAHTGTASRGQSGFPVTTIRWAAAPSGGFTCQPAPRTKRSRHAMELCNALHNVRLRQVTRWARGEGHSPCRKVLWVRTIRQRTPENCLSVFPRREPMPCKRWRCRSRRVLVRHLRPSRA